MMQIPTHSKVEFFFVGVGKCGTSWLYDYFKRHDHVSVPAIKEPYLIDCDESKREKLVSSLYSGGGKKADFSNVYYWDAENPSKIREYNPEAKIIITMRRPSERIASHFAFLARNADSHVQGKTLAEYLEGGDPEDIISRTDYHRFYDRYVAEFGQDKVLLLPLEQLKDAPQLYVDRLLEFMELPPVVLTPEDTKPVLKGSTARSALLARLAKRVAVGLRAVGLLRVLGTLKESMAIRRLLYRELSEKQQVDKNFGSATEAVAQMDRDYQTLMERCEETPLAC